MEGIDISEAVTRTGEEKTSSGGSRRRTPSVDKPHDGVFELLTALLSDEEAHEEIEVYAFEEDAKEDGKVIPQEVSEQLDLPEEVETFSWEDFFQLDLSDYEYVSYPKRKRGEDESGYVDDMDASLFTGDLTGDTKKALNGHYAGKIQEVFGPEDASADNPKVEIAIRAGRKSDHGDDFLEARKYQRLYVRSADTTPENVIKARRAVGELSDEEAEELLEELEDESEE